MLGALLALVVTTPLFSAPECITNYGQTACGWNCLANYGQVECAQWPGGECLANYGQVECGPAAPRGWKHAAIPQAECLANYGQIACGWNCLANYGQVECAQWPAGECLAQYGQVECGPEPPHRWTRYYRDEQEPPPQAECRAYAGQIACGYDCEVAGGEIRCARTPQGRCFVSGNTVQCFESFD